MRITVSRKTQNNLGDKPLVRFRVPARFYGAQVDHLVGTISGTPWLVLARLNRTTGEYDTIWGVELVVGGTTSMDFWPEGILVPAQAVLGISESRQRWVAVELPTASFAMTILHDAADADLLLT